MRAGLDGPEKDVWTEGLILRWSSAIMLFISPVVVFVVRLLVGYPVDSAILRQPYDDTGIVKVREDRVVCDQSNSYPSERHE